MLSESIVRMTKELEGLELEDYKKVINYSINLILNRENQMKLNQFIQIEEEQGDQITNVCLALVKALVKYRTSLKEFENDLAALLLSKDRKDYLKEKLLAHLYELRKIIYAQDLDDITQFQDLQWRLEIEMGSKTCKNSFIPNVLLSLHTKHREIENKTAMNCDFANLKNLHQSLLQAMKMHNSNKFKIARNSSV